MSVHGFWLLIDGREFYVPFAEFPWFQDATIAELGIVERPSREHLFWPRLDVDLSLHSLEDPSLSIGQPAAGRPCPPFCRART